MKNLDFIALLTSNTSKTSRIRTYTGTWHTGARRSPQSIAANIGSVVSLMDDKIDQLCKEDEGLLIYNFQRTGITNWEGGVLCSLEMVVKPLEELEASDVLVGRPMQLVVRDNGDVMNNLQALMLLDSLDEEEREAQESEAVTYGNYFDYRQSVMFVSIWNGIPIKDLEDLYKGIYDYDACLQENAEAFDTLNEAMEHVEQFQNKPVKCVAEVGGHKEMLPRLKSMGIGKYIVKLITLPERKVFQNKETLTKEHAIEEDTNSIQNALDDTDE